MEGITVLDELHRAVRKAAAREVAAAEQADSDTALADAATPGPSVDTAVAGAPPLADTALADTALADSDDDPLAAIHAQAIVPFRAKANAKRKGGADVCARAVKHGRLFRPRAVRVCMPADPADPAETRVVQVLAMVRGKTGRTLWVEFDKLPWLVSYACKEFMHLGVPLRPRECRKGRRKLTNTDVDGVWRKFDGRSGAWVFEFVKETGHVKADGVNFRRYFHPKQLTSPLYDKYVPTEIWAKRKFSQAFKEDKGESCKNLCSAWARAIRAGEEERFLSTNTLDVRMMSARQSKQPAHDLYPPINQVADTALAETVADAALAENIADTAPASDSLCL